MLFPLGVRPGIRTEWSDMVIKEGDGCRCRQLHIGGHGFDTPPR